MPSAFTAPIANQEGFTWRDYIERCVHNFIRFDDDLSKPLPQEIVPSDTHTANDVDLLLKEHEDLQALSHAQKIEKGRAVIRKREKDLREWREKARLYNEKYDAVLSGIVQWIPPTERHEKLKEFAISQIEGSKVRLSDYDGELEYLSRYSPEDAFADYCNNLRVSAERMRETIEKEKMWATEGTQWLKALRESLK